MRHSAACGECKQWSGDEARPEVPESETKQRIRSNESSQWMSMSESCVYLGEISSTGWMVWSDAAPHHFLLCTCLDAPARTKRALLSTLQLQPLILVCFQVTLKDASVCTDVDTNTIHTDYHSELCYWTNVPTSRTLIFLFHDTWRVNAKTVKLFPLFIWSSLTLHQRCYL